MTIGDFKNTVELQIGSHPRLVSNVVEAAECLTLRWPATAGRYYWAAQEACLAVLDGRASADEAENALLRAADEADVDVRIH